MSDEPQSAIERAIAYGIDVSLLRASLRLTPTERVRRGEEFARFAWEIREQGRITTSFREWKSADLIEHVFQAIRAAPIVIGEQLHRAHLERERRIGQRRR